MSETPCVVCGASAFHYIYDGTLKRCETCSHVAANMRVDRQLLQTIYSQNYFLGEEYVNYVEEKIALQRNFSRRLSRLASLSRFLPGEAVLEVGAAYGFFGEVLLARFPFLHYVGFEIVREACAYASRELKLNVKCCDFLEAGQFPACRHVFLWDVIEHLHEPQRYVEKMSSCLEGGGKLYLTTGDIAALLPKWQKEKWRMIHPPSHLHYFSRMTLTRLLSNYGLTVTNVSYPPTARSLRQIFYSLFILKHHGRGGIRQALYNMVPRRATISVNTFDIMMVVAEKR